MRSPRNTPLLQLALDVASIDRALAIAEEAIEHVDRLEVGTPLIQLEGAISSISALSRRFPNVPIIADAKIMDRGAEIALACLNAGATGVIAQAAAPRETLEAVSSVCTQHHAEVMFDSLGIDSVEDLAARIHGIECSRIILHRGKDEQARGAAPPLGALEDSARHPLPLIAIAGGIDQESIAACVASPFADVVIVGEAIIASETPRVSVEVLRRICQETSPAGRIR